MQPAFRYKFSIHLAGWVVFFIIPLLLSPIHGFAANLHDPTNLISMLLRNVLWMFLFYINLWYFTPILLKNKGVGIYLVSVLIGIFLISFINSRLHHYFSDLFRSAFDVQPPLEFPQGKPLRRTLFGPPVPFFSNLLISVMVASVGTSLALWGDRNRARVEEQERAIQKMASELAILKLQISPHFLFNTLNNIRWLVRSKSDQAEQAVVRLSQLLRYILYQANADKVPLEGELAHLFDYIALQRLRLTNDQSFIFSGLGDAQGKMVTPLLFVPIVENVFKYGDFQSGFQNHIHLSVDDQHLILKTENKILIRQETPEKDNSGIGLANVKKRLSLDYPGRHTLRFWEENGIFRLQLEIVF